MNIALEKTEEHVDGVKKRTYGDAFVRGNNGEALSTSLHASSTDFSSYVYLSRLGGWYLLQSPSCSLSRHWEEFGAYAWRQGYKIGITHPQARW